MNMSKNKSELKDYIDKHPSSVRRFVGRFGRSAISDKQVLEFELVVVRAADVLLGPDR